MIRNKSFIIIPLIAIFLLFSIPIHSQSANNNLSAIPFSQIKNPNTFGEMADNGVIFAVWYSGFLVNFQNAQGQNIRTNNLFVTFANPYNYTMNMLVTVELLNPNNLSKIEYSHTQNFIVNGLSIQSFSLNLPVNTGHYDAIIQYENVQVQFEYNPSVALLPANINTIGQESIFVLENIGISFTVLMIASISSEIMLKKMYYFPKKSLSTYILVILGFFATIFIWLNALYYYIVSIPYYYYFIPLFFIALFFELSIRHKDIPESVFISISTNKNDADGDEIPVFDDEYYIIPRNDKYIVINKDSFLKAFKRLFGIYTYLEMPNNIVKYSNLKGNRYYYFLEPSDKYRTAITQKDYPAESRFEKIFNKVRTKSYITNLSNTAHLGDVLRVMTNIKQIEQLAKEKKNYLDELTELKIKIHNATMTANFQWLYKIGMLVDNIKDFIPESDYNLIMSEIESAQKQIIGTKQNEDKKPESEQNGR